MLPTFYGAQYLPGVAVLQNIVYQKTLKVNEKKTIPKRKGKVMFISQAN